MEAILNPLPQVSLGKALAEHRIPSAMIDVSDGLSTDLLHICEESGCGAEIELDCLPISSELREYQRKSYWMALHGGEDYQLLFSVPPDHLKRLEKLRKHFLLTQIGRMTSKKTIYVIGRNHQKKKLVPLGFQHF